MDNATLIWCHGKDGLPWGDKSKQLADVASQMGFTMDAPDFSDCETADDRVSRLATLCEDKTGPIILAGSSMGGYVATALAKQVEVQGLFLLAPAFYFPGYDLHVFSNLPKNVTVVHGWRDAVVPVDNSIRFAKLHKADLHVLDGDHRLTENIDQIATLFQTFLDGLKNA